MQDLGAIPLLAGAEALARKNIKSSLYSQNRLALAAQHWPDSITRQARFDLLFDPQTSGGLLAGIPAADYKNLSANFHQQFYTIGEVLGGDDLSVRIEITDT